MLNTKQDVINTVKRIFPGMPTNTTATDLFDHVDREIRSQVHFNSDYETINTIANGTKLYNFTNSVVGVWTCRYQNSSTTNDFTEMFETTVERIEQDDYSQLKRTGTPTMFAVDAGQLFVHPAPTVNSTNGYPQFILRVDRASSMNMNTNMPGEVPSHDAWKYGMCAKYAVDVGDPRAQGFDVAYQRAVAKLHAYTLSKNRYAPSPTVRPRQSMNRTVVK